MTVSLMLSMDHPLTANYSWLPGNTYSIPSCCFAVPDILL